SWRPTVRREVNHGSASPVFEFYRYGRGIVTGFNGEFGRGRATAITGRRGLRRLLCVLRRLTRLLGIAHHLVVRLLGCLRRYLGCLLRCLLRRLHARVLSQRRGDRYRHHQQREICPHFLFPLIVEMCASRPEMQWLPVKKCHLGYLSATSIGRAGFTCSSRRSRTARFGN